MQSSRGGVVKQIKPVSKFLIEIPQAFEETITLDSGLQLYVDPSYRPEWHATCYGVVKYSPMGNKNIKPGDTVFVSYFIISDRVYPDYSETFIPVTEGSPYFKQWKNGKDYWITMRAIKVPSGILRWTVFLQDDRMELIGEGVEGTQSDVERFLSKFSFEDTGKYKHTNQIDIDGQTLWKVDDFNIFAKIEQNALVSVSDRVILQPIEEDLTERFRIANLLESQSDTVGGLYEDRGIVISGGESLGLQKGTIVGFDSNYCEKYTFFGKEYFLIKESRIDCILAH